MPKLIMEGTQGESRIKPLQDELEFTERRLQSAEDEAKPIIAKHIRQIKREIISKQEKFEGKG